MPFETSVLAAFTRAPRKLFVDAPSDLKIDFQRLLGEQQN
jgi:hypothetical protein